MLFKLTAIIVFSFLTITVTGQDSLGKISNKYFESISGKSEMLNRNLEKKSQKILEKMQARELRLQRKLSGIDSLAAVNIFSNSREKYNELKNKLKSSSQLSVYVPQLDSFATSFKFLESNQQWLANVKEGKEKLEEASSKLKELQGKLQGAEEIKQFLKERKKYLREKLEQFGLAKELKKINKDVYYFSQQVNDYRKILRDPKKAERKAIELLSKTKLFRDFMRKNSMLASLFRMPDANDPLAQANIAGLQTRAQVNNLIQQQINAGGPNAQRQMQQNIQAAQTELQQLRNKIGSGGGSSDDDLPDFKPNGQKTKSFAQRLEYGMNIQSQKAQYYFPNTGDIGLSVGYKLNDKSVIGIGASYKVGFGTGWRNIRFSQQGVGLRSYVDWKIKGSIWISGGMEMNYKNLFNSISQLRNYDAWQQSGLIGISKKYQVSKKIKGKIQFLWDFLSYQQKPKTQPIVFRVGYNF